MKCDCERCERCERCEGEGTIECPDCDGEGSFSDSIETIKLDKKGPHFAELAELQKDAQRVIRQASELSKLNPARSKSYAAQPKATLFVINSQAEAVAKRK